MMRRKIIHLKFKLKLETITDRDVNFILYKRKKERKKERKKKRKKEGERERAQGSFSNSVIVGKDISG